MGKVRRDGMMKEVGEKYGEQGFEEDMGYGRKEDLEGIEVDGVLEEEGK